MFSVRTSRGAAILVWDPSKPDEPPKTILETQDGFIWDISPSWDGAKLVFSYKEKNNDPFHVWEINTEGHRFHDHYPLVGYGSYYVKENPGEAPVDENGGAALRARPRMDMPGAVAIPQVRDFGRVF